MKRFLIVMSAVSLFPLGTLSSPHQDVPDELSWIQHAGSSPATSTILGEGREYSTQWIGGALRVLTSRPACEAARSFYHKTFPKYPKLKCKKAGRVWYLVRA